MINYTSIDFRNDRLKKIQRLLSDLAPHEHADGINECAICDQGLDEAILIELRKVPTPVRQEEGEWRGRVRDALVVAFITGCHCGGKNNPDWRNHAEHCPAAYFGRAIEEFDSINASLRDKTEPNVKELVERILCLHQSAWNGKRDFTFTNLFHLVTQWQETEQTLGEPEQTDRLAAEKEEINESART